MRRKLSVLAGLCISMLAAADQPFDIRPGLWKVALTIDAAGGSQTRSTTACITADDIRELRVLQMGQRPGMACTSQVARQTASAIEGVVLCPVTGGIARTQVSFRATSPMQLTGSMRALGATLSQPVDARVAAEWLAAQCPAAEAEDPALD